MPEDPNNPTPMPAGTEDLESRIGTGGPGAALSSQQTDPGQQPYVQDQSGATLAMGGSGTPEVGQPPVTGTKDGIKSLLTGIFGQHGMGGYLMNSFGLPTPDQRQQRDQNRALQQQSQQAMTQMHQATARSIDLGNQEVEVPQAPLPDGTPQAPIRLPQKYVTPALVQTLKNAANPNLQMTTIGPEHVAVSPQLAPLLGKQYPTLLLDKSILGTAAQQNKTENAPAKPLKVGYDQGIPVSVTDSQGTTYDINDPNLPQALKPIVQSAQNAHKQHLNEAAQSQARAFGQQMKMNEVKQAALTNSTKTMIEASPKVISFVDRIDKLIDEQKAQLGPLAGRWNEFMTGKVGEPNAEFTKLRTNVGLLTTLLMRMHVGARGGEYIMKHFQDLVDSGKQSPENLKAAMGEIKQYAQDVQSEAPPGSLAAPKPSIGGAGGGGGKMSIINRKTGERRESTDGGQTWHPAPVNLPPGFELETPPSNIPEGFEIEKPTSPAPTAPPKEGFLHSLGSDLFGIAKGIPQMALSASPLGKLQELLPASMQQSVGYSPGLDQIKAMAAADTARKQAGRSAAYRAIAPLGELAGANVGGMEQAAAAGDPGAVLGHAAAVPTAMALTAGLGKAGGALARSVADSGAAGKMVPRLLNASGDISPETLTNLRTAEPALQRAGAPNIKTVAGAAQHFTNLSNEIQNKIAPIIEQASGKDVSESTARIAANIRSQINPEMQSVNPGVAKTLEKLATSVEGTKDLGSLDNLRKQIEQRKQAINPTGVAKPYLANTLSDVLDAIAGHVQEVDPTIPARALRTQQSALMKLADTFQEHAAKLDAQRMAEQGLTTSQKAKQAIPGLIKMGMSPKQAIASQMMQPSTASEMVQKAFRGKGAYQAAPPPSSVPPEAQGMSEENLNAIRQGGEATRRSNTEFVQDIIRRQGLPVDPHMADVEALLKQRAAEFARQGEQVGGFPLKSQTPTTTSSEDIPPSVSYYDKYGRNPK